MKEELTLFIGGCLDGKMMSVDESHNKILAPKHRKSAIPHIPGGNNAAFISPIENDEYYRSVMVENGTRLCVFATVAAQDAGIISTLISNYKNENKNDQNTNNTAAGYSRSFSASLRPQHG